VGTERKLLVMGSAYCLDADLSKVDVADYDVMAVNHAGVHYPGKLRYWASVHPEFFTGKKKIDYIGERKSCGYDMDFLLVFPWKDIWTPEWPKFIEIRFDKLAGTSGLYAARAGLALGYTDITLAGVPMRASEGSLQYGEVWPGFRTSKTKNAHRSAWIRAKDEEFKGRVRSLSGWTREILSGE